MAASCGKLDGAIGGALVGVLLGALFVHSKRDKKEQRLFNVIVGIVIALACSLVSWMIGGVIAKAQWLGQSEEISGFERSGMSHESAMQRVQELENNKRTSLAFAAAFGAH